MHRLAVREELAGAGVAAHVAEPADTAFARGRKRYAKTGKTGWRHLREPLAMFPRLGYARVWAKLTAGLAGLDVPSPAEKALRDLRRRLGPAPVKALFEVVAGPLAQPRTPGVCFAGLRTVAFDGLNSLKVPDTGRNRCWIGRIRYRMGFAGYPTLRLMALAETGTRGLLGAVLGSAGDRDEAYLARRLLHLLRPGMLLLIDRAFDANTFLAEVHATGAMLHRGPVPADHHAPGPPALPGAGPDPALPREMGNRDRLLRAALHPAARARAAPWRPARPGTGNLGAADPLPAPADGHGRCHRGPARHRPGPGQLHHRPGNCPRPAHRRRGHLPHDPAAQPGVIGRAVLATLLPARRPRYSARIVKCSTSRYHENDDSRPRLPAAITAIGITVHTPPLAPGAPGRARYSVQAPRPDQPPTRRQRITEIMTSQSPRDWSGHELAQLLGVKPRNMHTQLGEWAKIGFFTRTGYGTYALNTPSPASSTTASGP